MEHARALQSELAALYPKAPRAFALFMERAMRLELYDLAVEIGDSGVGNLDERGVKRIERLLRRIPADGGK